MSSVDDGRTRSRRRTTPRQDPPRLPAAPNHVTVIAVGPDTLPQPLGHAAPSPDAVHFLQVGRSVVFAGSIEDLRGFVADFGMKVAEMEHEMLEELVEEGRRRAKRAERRLA